MCMSNFHAYLYVQTSRTSADGGQRKRTVNRGVGKRKTVCTALAVAARTPCFVSSIDHIQYVHDCGRSSSEKNGEERGAAIDNKMNINDSKGEYDVHIDTWVYIHQAATAPVVAAGASLVAPAGVPSFFSGFSVVGDVTPPPRPLPRPAPRLPPRTAPRMLIDG